MFDTRFAQLVQARLGVTSDRIFSSILAAGTDLPAVVIETVGHQQQKAFGNERVTETGSFVVNYIAPTYADLSQAIRQLRTLDGYSGPMGDGRAIRIRQTLAFSEFEEGETLRAVFNFDVVAPEV